MNKLHRFISLLKKELIQLLKNPKTRMTAFMPPLLQLFLLGYAATMDLKDVPIGILDHAQTIESRALVSKFTANDVFHATAPLLSEKDMQTRMADRSIKVALVIPADFSESLLQNTSPHIQFIVDGRNSSSAGIALSYANQIVSLYNQQYYPETVSKIKILSRGWYNPNYSAQMFMIPSLLAILTLLALTLLVSLSFAKEREGGTLDQLSLTPYSPFELLAAKGLASVFIGLLQLTFAMLFVLFWFKIPYVSEFWLLYLLFISFLMAAVGIGLAVSVHCANLQQAMIWTFLIAVQFAMLSGMATPLSSMPENVQNIMVINPIRWSIEALHRLFLEGATFTDILPTYAILGGIGIVTFGIACGSLSYQRSH